MGIIQTLDIQLTNMIAAGEVVERPMGIVKELVENAIDAKATRIEINTLQGGIESIEVIDNGMGMDSADATTAFQRHATSKISKTQDLWAIRTLGFRGEALPSIASVSQVILETNNGEEATRVEIKYGNLISARPFPCNQGTLIKITGLFQKTPARLKHLKTVSYENSLIADVIQKFACSHPEIAFVFTNDGKESFRTSGSGDLLEVVFQLYGKDIAKNAIAIDERDADYHLTGICIHPQFTRSTRNAISIFLNERIVRPYRIQKAVVDSYSNYIPSDRYPIVILNIKMDSQLVDVNVHPSKWEVRLSKEQQLEHLIKEMLPKILERHIQAPQIPIQHVVKEKVEIQQFFTDSEPEIEKKVDKPILLIHEDKQVYEPHVIQEEVVEKIEPLPQRSFPKLRVLGQLHGKYILCEGDEGLYIIDQHAAQERVNFEKFQDEMENKQPVMMDCLIPFNLHATNDCISRIDEINAAVLSIGIQFEVFGSDRLIVRQTPIWMKDIEAMTFLQDLLDSFKDEREISSKKIHKDKIATMACHHSIRFNRILNNDEMGEVVSQLENCHQPYHCPHGRPTFICIVESQLEREFLR